MHVQLYVINFMLQALKRSPFPIILGLTVTTDVRYSHVMGRQYLNVLFTPTIAFKGHTEGLCGMMDNDPSNDLRGPSGEQYSDPIQFADSCK